MQNDPTKPDPGIQRAAIDAGATGDKVPAGDPAAAPIQTDAEAAGTPTSASDAAADVRAQMRIRREADAAGTRPVAAGADPAARGRRGPSAALIGVIVVAAAALIGILVGLA